MTVQNQQNALLGKIAAYTEILAKDPKSTIFVSLGESYRKMGMLDDARQVIEKGLEAHPNFSPAHIVFARILCQQGEYEPSEASFAKALEHDPESLAAMVGFARLKILLGDENGARELLLQARQYSPADPVINKLILSLPEVETEPIPEPASKTEEVVPEKDEQRMVDSDESPEPPLVSSTVAELYLKQGLKEEALDVYRKLSSEDPHNLLYRRKIRDLEEELTAPDTETIDVDSDVTIEGEEETPSIGLQEYHAEPPEPDLDSTELIADDEVEISHQSDEAILSTLNKWLDSIHRRRKNV